MLIFFEGCFSSEKHPNLKRLKILFICKSVSEGNGYKVDIEFIFLVNVLITFNYVGNFKIYVNLRSLLQSRFGFKF